MEGLGIVAPKRKRYNRRQRLYVAERWIPTYTGKNIVKGYSKWFGVDKVCAIIELELLGHEIDPEYKEQIIKQRIARSKASKERKKEKEKEKEKEEEEEKLESYCSLRDTYFYYIAGYTSGGVPFGITWEEYEEYEENERDFKEDNYIEEDEVNYDKETDDGEDDEEEEEEEEEEYDLPF